MKLGVNMEEQKLVSVKQVQCLRCGRIWLPHKVGERPRVCPGCRSIYWDRPRERVVKQPRLFKPSDLRAGGADQVVARAEASEAPKLLSLSAAGMAILEQAKSLYGDKITPDQSEALMAGVRVFGSDRVSQALAKGKRARAGDLKYALDLIKGFK